MKPLNPEPDAVKPPEPGFVKQVAIAQMEASAPWARWNEYSSRRPMGWMGSRYPLELGMLLEGRLRRHFQDWSMDLEPGQAWLIGMWEPQNWEVLEGPCHEIVFFISPEVLLNLRLPELPEAQLLQPFMVSPQLRPQVPPHARDYVLNLAQQVMELRRQWLKTVSCGAATAPQVVVRHSGQGYREPLEASRTSCVQLRLIMMQLLMCLLEEWHPTSDAMRHEPFTQISPAIQRALQTRELVTVNEAAHLCGLNRNLFARRFRQMMGMSFSEFSLHHRLNGVSNDLDARHEPIEIVALRWGFVNGSHLHRCFVRYYGCTPAQYRRRRHDTLEPRRVAPFGSMLLSHPESGLADTA